MSPFSRRAWRGVNCKSPASCGLANEVRIQPNPQQPHSATADFDLVRMEMANEVGRERWTLSLQFQFLQHIPPELIVFNPMGIVITYLQGDRATVTGDQ